MKAKPSLFKKAEAGNAFLKMAMYGDTGSGKTLTSSLIAIGLAKHLRSLKMELPPVFFVDTETGSDWMEPVFKKAGVDLYTVKTRAFVDLKQAVQEADASNAILIVDSISHFWEELMQSFLSSKKQRVGQHARLEIQDWNVIKPNWAEFTKLFLNSNAHIIVCGREASIYETVEDESSGKKQMIASGTRMAAEKGLGYEASLLVQMASVQQQNKRAKEKRIVRRANIQKDRGRLLDGRSFDNPTFENFLPHISQIKLGGKHEGIPAGRNSTALFPHNDRLDRTNQRKVVLDEIMQLLVIHFAGQTAEEKRTKAKLLRKHFKAAWAEIETLMSLEDLRQGYDTLHVELNGVPSKYHLEAPEPFDDGIPAEFLGEPAKVAEK